MAKNRNKAILEVGKSTYSEMNMSNCNGRRGVRDCDLLDPAYQQLAQYSKEEMLKYQQKIWTDRIMNRSQFRSHSSTNDEKVQNIAKRIRNSEVILDKNNFLFNHNTTKGEDSYIMDYMHGSSLIFGNIRSTIDKDMEEDFCYFCNNTNDSQGHQLLGCTEVADLTHDKLQQQIDGTQQYVEEIVLPKDKTLQRIFIERIIFLKVATKSPWKRHLFSMYDLPPYIRIFY